MCHKFQFQKRIQHWYETKHKMRIFTLFRRGTFDFSQTSLWIWNHVADFTQRNIRSKKIMILFFPYPVRHTMCTNEIVSRFLRTCPAGRNDLWWPDKGYSPRKFQNAKTTVSLFSYCTVFSGRTYICFFGTFYFCMGATCFWVSVVFLWKRVLHLFSDCFDHNPICFS